VKRFEGRNVIVTGASRGIGAALAERLCAQGANVALVARTAEKHDHLAGSLADTAQRCARFGTAVHTIVADLADADSRATVVPTALEVFDGRLDILVNNAAAAIYQSLLTYPLKRRRIMFEVNVHAPVDLIQAAAPVMAARGEGWILNVSSASAKHAAGPPFRTAGRATEIGLYGSTKAALNRETNALAVELYDRNIRVNTIEPRAAVMSEGAEALVGGLVTDDQIESMEAMVEAAVALCDCPLERTGQILSSLDLLDELGLTVLNLDASGPYPGGQRVWRG
jgi:citronellol/citronellal dehydrogenase